MRIVGRVNAEGGPLIIADALIARSWRGTEGAGEDYGGACGFFDEHPQVEGGEIQLRTGRVFVWEMKGPGTAELYKGESGDYVLVRAWPKDPDDREIGSLLAEAPTTEFSIGCLDIKSGCLAILWAAESGEGIDDGRLNRCGSTDLAIQLGATGLMVPVARRTLSLTHADPMMAKGFGRRLRIF